MFGLRLTVVALALGAVLLAQTCALGVLEWNACGALICTLALCALGGLIAHAARFVTWAAAFALIDENPPVRTGDQVRNLASHDVITEAADVA